MGIKLKNIDPKSTDFSPQDIIINVKDGTLFYKSNNNDIYKVQGDNLSTADTEFITDNIIRGNLHISGALLPTTNESFDLGSAEKIWHTLHVKDDSIKMYKDGTEVGKIQFESGSGLKIKDKEGNTKGIIGNVDGGSF